MTYNEICVNCGNTLPAEGEYGMVCYDCQAKYKSVSDKSDCDCLERILNTKLKWYQRIAIKSVKKPLKRD